MTDANGVEIKVGQQAKHINSNEAMEIIEHPKKWIGGMAISSKEDTAYWALTDGRAKKLIVTNSEGENDTGN